MNHFQTDTVDLADLMWTGDDTAIVVWDSAVECRLLIYSPTQGLLAKHEPYEGALGFRNVTFSPDGQFLIAGACDQWVRLYHHITWKEITEFEHKKAFTEDDGIHVYSEDEYREGGPYAEEAVSSRYVMQELPIKLNPKSVSK